jgi:glycosyltransferase involved in cell wall biosynthesis
MISLIVLGQIALLRAQARYRFDETIAFWALPAGLWALAGSLLLGARYSVWTLGSDIWLYGKRPLFRRILGLVLDRSDRVFSDGQALAASTQELTRNPVVFLPSSRELPRAPDRHPTRANDVMRILFVGRLHPHKGADLLIEAMGLLPTDLRSKVMLDLIGGGESLKALEERAHALGLKDRVVFRGFRDEAFVAECLARADFLVIPSRVESISVVFSDALQMGCPVVATNVGDLGDLVSANGVGLVCAPTAPAIARGIGEMTQRDRSEFEARALTLAKRFDLGQTAARLARTTQ